MNILLVHQNFPGQFKHLAPALQARGHKVVGLSMRGKSDKGGAENIEIHHSKPRCGSAYAGARWRSGPAAERSRTTAENVG